MSGRALLPVLVAALLAVAGCTGGSAPSPSGAPAAPEPRDVVAAATRALVDAGTARVQVSTGTVTAGGPMRFEPFATDLTATVGTRGAQVVVVDDRSWLRLGGDTAWRPLSPGLLPVGAVAGALRAAPGLTGVTEEAVEPVGGIPAVRYGGVVDLAAAKAADPASAGRFDELAGLVSPTPRVTAWVGAADAAQADRGRLVQLRLAPAAEQAPAAGAVTIGFSEPGLPVRVSAP